MHGIETNNGRTGGRFERGKNSVVIRVYPTGRGWNVVETGGGHGAQSLNGVGVRPTTHQDGKAMSDFETKDEALSYAMSLAEERLRAVVEVYGEDGALEARSAYGMARSFHPLSDRD